MVSTGLRTPRPPRFNTRVLNKQGKSGVGQILALDAHRLVLDLSRGNLETVDSVQREFLDREAVLATVAQISC